MTEYLQPQKHSKNMSKAGLAVFLSVAFFALSGILNKTNAQEKLTMLSKTETRPSYICSTPLKDFFSTEKCEVKKTAQIDTVVKGANREANEITYATEPTTYIAPQITVTPTVTATISTSMVPSPMQQAPMDLFPASGPNLDANLIFDLINAHRASIGKPVFQTDAALCQLAQVRSTELQGELFEGKGALHSGLYNRNLPYWVTENAKYGSNEAGTVRWWLNSPIHRSAIEGDHVYSCGACNGTKCSQLFTSYTPKGGIAVATQATAITK